MSHLIFRLRRFCHTVMAWTAHQLVTLRISPAGLALSAIAFGMVTMPLLYAHQPFLAALFVVIYRLLSMLSGWVSSALGHFDVRQRYLRPFMEIILIMSVMGGLSLYQPERLMLPALALVIVTLVFDLERRLVALLREAQKMTVNVGRIERLIDVVTGSAGRTLLLIAACYWPTPFLWSGFGFAGFCLVVLIWRLIFNYRALGRHSNAAGFACDDVSGAAVSSGTKQQEQA